MKLEIVRHGDTVEIHRVNDDGSKTVWICENMQAAIFKLAALVSDQPEQAEKAGRRSILVGDFEKPEQGRKPTLDDEAAKAAKRLEDAGYARKSTAPVPVPMPMPVLPNPLAPMPSSPFIVPGIGTAPAPFEIQPWTPMPYSQPTIWVGVKTVDSTGGDLSWGAVGSSAGNGVITCSAGPVGSGEAIGNSFSFAAGNAMLVDEPVEYTASNSNATTTVFKTSLKFGKTG